ncbi:hypothetical protein [Vibrio phage phiKT1024]|nr:hypothetical protein [Vibrio phage phiKT1024]
MFEEYYEEMLFRRDKLNYNYLGISRKEYPKWPGWKIINQYKENGVNIKDIEDERLDILVRNFYYTLYMQENL